MAFHVHVCAEKCGKALCSVSYRHGTYIFITTTAVADGAAAAVPLIIVNMCICKGAHMH